MENSTNTNETTWSCFVQDNGDGIEAECQHMAYCLDLTWSIRHISKTKLVASVTFKGPRDHIVALLSYKMGEDRDAVRDALDDLR